MPNRPTLLLVRGIPGAGKSSYASKLKDFLHLENDQFLIENGKYRWSPKRRQRAVKQCENAAYDALKEGKNVVVANCFLRKSSMAAFYRIARETNATVEELLLDGGFHNVHDVPESVVDGMRAILEP